MKKNHSYWCMTDFQRDLLQHKGGRTKPTHYRKTYRPCKQHCGSFPCPPGSNTHCYASTDTTPDFSDVVDAAQTVYVKLHGEVIPPRIRCVIPRKVFTPKIRVMIGKGPRYFDSEEQAQAALDKYKYNGKHSNTSTVRPWEALSQRLRGAACHSL